MGVTAGANAWMHDAADKRQRVVAAKAARDLRLRRCVETNEDDRKGMIIMMQRGLEANLVRCLVIERKW